MGNCLLLVNNYNNNGVLIFYWLILDNLQVFWWGLIGINGNQGLLQKKHVGLRVFWAGLLPRPPLKQKNPPNLSLGEMMGVGLL